MSSENFDATLDRYTWCLLAYLRYILLSSSLRPFRQINYYLTNLDIFGYFFFYLTEIDRIFIYTYALILHLVNIFSVFHSIFRKKKNYRTKKLIIWVAIVGPKNRWTYSLSVDLVMLLSLVLYSYSLRVKAALSNYKIKTQKF